MDLPDHFDTFIDNITLGDSPDKRIQSAVDSLTKVLADHYDLGSDDVFMQGSYPNGTAVKPVGTDAEYDVDLVAICAADGASADQALDGLEEAIRSHVTYDGMVDDEGKQPTPCVRLRYADDAIGKFHVDIVPARRSASAPLEVPRRGAGWHDSDPAGYTQWALSQGKRFARTVQMLKRWRDENQNASTSIKSIVLQVLAGEHLDSSAGDAEALLKTVEGIQTALHGHPNSPPKVQNPVATLDENLAARWTPSSYREFRVALSDAVDLAQRAFDATEEATAHRLWRKLLGDDFPKAPEGGSSARVPPVVPPAHRQDHPYGHQDRVRHG